MPFGSLTKTKHPTTKDPLMSVLSHLQLLSSRLVLSADENASIQRSIATLRTRLAEYFSSQVAEQFLFGSYTRGTILPRVSDILSDVDYMVVFADGDQHAPQTLLNRLRRFVEARYSRSEVYQSHPTVVLNLNHIRFELVPAYRGGFTRALSIPAPASDFLNWVTTDPNGFNQTLINKNTAHRSLIKPTIRLMKHWNARADYVYNSFDFEKHLVAGSYFYCSTLRDFALSAVDSLSAWGIGTTKSAKVERAKKLASEIRSLEKAGDYVRAQSSVERLFPMV